MFGIAPLLALAIITTCTDPSINPPVYPILSVDVDTHFELGHSIGTAFKSRITTYVTHYHTYTQVHKMDCKYAHHTDVW